jgi:hypothetical protein
MSPNQLNAYCEASICRDFMFCVLVGFPQSVPRRGGGRSGRGSLPVPDGTARLCRRRIGDALVVGVVSIAGVDPDRSGRSERGELGTLVV